MADKEKRPDLAELKAILEAMSDEEIANRIRSLVDDDQPDPEHIARDKYLKDLFGRV